MLDALLPTLVPAAGASLVLLLRQQPARFVVLYATALTHFALVTTLWLEPPVAPPGGLIGVGPAGLLVLTVVSLLYALVAVYLWAYTRRESRGAPRLFLACHLFSLAAMSLAATAQHWGVYWVAMEATTLTTAPLLFYYHGARSLEATWKYVLVCSVGIAFALLGTFFLALAGAAAPEQWDYLSFAYGMTHAPQYSKPWLRLAAVFLLIGYGTKMGLAPMHSWKPDAYGEAPPPVAALLSGGLTSCGFLGLLRMTQLCDMAGESGFVHELLITTGLLSLAVAAGAIVGQQNYRRLLAYSSVEHMGVLALALGVGGLATTGALLHLVANALNKGVLFLAAGNVLQATRTSAIGDLRGLLVRMPLSGTFLLLGWLATVGLPPFGLFVSEFTILRGMFATGHGLVAAAYLLLLAIVFAGFGRAILTMLHGTTQEPRVRELADGGVVALLPIAVLVALVLMLGVAMPDPLLTLIENAARGGSR